jgi:hypothetical protein
MLEAYDPEGRLDLHDIIHVTLIGISPDRTPTCNYMPTPVKTVTYKDWGGNCESAGSVTHTLTGNACFDGMAWWPACNATLIVVEEGSGDCLKFDFLNNCCCP